MRQLQRGPDQGELTDHLSWNRTNSTGAFVRQAKEPPPSTATYFRNSENYHIIIIYSKFSF